ncbi:MAG: type I DNA topoisomerase [Kiritimatiellae bacterium]|nr:type I DNA topoisomerase [Kiritimatiellia bacterium]
MAKKLVIVESPAKAKTIGKILGSGYVVKSSVGHIRDLPERTLGVDVNRGFLPKYVFSKGKAKVIAELKKAAKSCESIYLAPDPDREGEAIAWHLQESLSDVAKDKPFYRVQYNEITPRAVRAAFDEPGVIDMRRVDAQQARRVLDRIVGYKVSPMLWRRIRKGLSAGRVQSVALRLVAEREREIQAFKVEEYWVLGAEVRRETAPLDAFSIRLAGIDDAKPAIGSREGAAALLADLEGSLLRVKAVKTRETTRRPLPPFITSTLQQAASSVCGFSPSRTMRLAQSLYEGVDFGDGGPVGLITYMRTDSVNVARDAQSAARQLIVSTYGEDYCPEKPNFYKSRSSAQEAHEAIRPTDPGRAPESLKGVLDAPSLRLYELIWKRFIASQMTAAKIAQKTVEIAPEKAPLRHSYLFTVSASEVIFSGFLKVMALDIRKKKAEEEGAEEDAADDVDRLPPLEAGDPLCLLKWLSERKETKPPARYSEASLIRALEGNGVGRPSTYASIIETLNARDYTTREKRQLTPTDLGLAVNDLLVGNLPQLFDVGFTATMEEGLDRIEEGQVEWAKMMEDFYGRFQEWMEKCKAPPADAGKVSAVLTMLEQVREWGPEVKRGRRTYSDEKFVASVRDQIGDKDVTEKQLAALVKIAIRYRSQIKDADAALDGLGFSEALEQDRAAPSNEEAERRFEVLAGMNLSETQEPFVASLRQQADSGRKLSERQLAALDRIIVQNAPQIENFDEVKNALGLSADAPEMAPDHESPEFLALLQNVGQWQEPVKRGKRVFDDQAFFKSLKDQFDGKRALSPRQRYALRRLVFRYKAQIPDFDKHAERLGLSKKSESKEKN